MDRHVLAGPGLRAEIKADGAELCRLWDASGRDYLWPATAPWTRHAPVLFPIVGRLKDDTLIHRGTSTRMTQHGFARDRRFTWTDRTAEGCRLVLCDDAATRAVYPFAFQFEVAYALAGAVLTTRFQITNPGTETLPASMGAHPAFRWPLAEGTPKEAYSLTFDHRETGDLRGVRGGLLTGADRPSPIVGETLALAPSLFAGDALILEHPASRSVRYAAAEGPAITVSWEGFPQLGIWSRADADLLCIEPWCGMASPLEFEGEFSEKPWLMLIPPGESVRATYRIEVTPG
jgi:galactose mutarotase-like enzyme